tara:strand:- start:249 stop:455 length:207 start_codon:yes stop_codon:yes gene_type:complete
VVESKTYKVYTKWIGYSEIEVEAKSEEEASEIVDEGSYDDSNEKLTGNGLDYGCEDEEVYKVEEIKDE